MRGAAHRRAIRASCPSSPRLPSFERVRRCDEGLRAGRWTKLARRVGGPRPGREAASHRRPPPDPPPIIPRRRQLASAGCARRRGSSRADPRRFHGARRQGRQRLDHAGAQGVRLRKRSSAMTVWCRAAACPAEAPRAPGSRARQTHLQLRRAQQRAHSFDGPVVGNGFERAQNGGLLRRRRRGVEGLEQLPHGASPITARRATAASRRGSSSGPSRLQVADQRALPGWRTCESPRTSGRPGVIRRWPASSCRTPTRSRCSACRARSSAPP